MPPDDDDAAGGRPHSGNGHKTGRTRCGSAPFQRCRWCWRDFPDAELLDGGLGAGVLELGLGGLGGLLGGLLQDGLGGGVDEVLGFLQAEA